MRFLGPSRAAGSVSTSVDHIVFQHRESFAVEVVTFDRALALVETKAGWVQRFCSPR